MMYSGFEHCISELYEWNRWGYFVVQLLTIPLLLLVYLRLRKPFVFLFLVSHLVSVFSGVLDFLAQYSESHAAWWAVSVAVYPVLLVTRLLAILWCFAWFWQTRKRKGQPTIESNATSG